MISLRLAGVKTCTRDGSDMPDLNGLELARLLKEGRAECEALEAVILTGQATAAKAVGAIRNHVLGFLSKPTRLGAIIEGSDAPARH